MNNDMKKKKSTEQVNDQCSLTCGNEFHCPECGSVNLKNEDSFLIEGIRCKDCGWCVMDAGAALA